MTKRASEDGVQMPKRHNPFAAIDDNPLPADCWYIIYDMLSKREDRTTLKLLNKSACALFTRRCTYMTVSYTSGKAYVSLRICAGAAVAMPHWLLTPNLCRVRIHCDSASYVLDKWVVRCVLRSVKQRASTPISLVIPAAQWLEDEDLPCVPGKISKFVHTLEFITITSMCYLTHARPETDLSGVTIIILAGDGRSPAYARKPDNLSPLAVRYFGETVNVPEAMKALATLFSADILFVRDSTTAYDFGGPR